MLTEEDLTIAARRLCDLRSGKTFAVHNPLRFELAMSIAKSEILSFLEILKALNGIPGFDEKIEAIMREDPDGD